MDVNGQHRSTLTQLFGKEVLVAFLLVIGLVGITTSVSQIPLVHLPGYLIILGSDVIQSPLLPRVSGWVYLFFFTMYLYGIAVVLGNLYQWGRSRRAQ